MKINGYNFTKRSGFDPKHGEWVGLQNAELGIREDALVTSVLDGKRLPDDVMLHELENRVKRRLI